MRPGAHPDRIFRVVSAVAILGAWVAFTDGTVASAEELASPIHAEVLPPVQVFGEGPESLVRPLDPKRLSKDRLEQRPTTDIHKALQQTAGAYAREEDGEGLRANIGLRGTNPDRSKKVVLLEDGVLIAPAPYSAPAAYYTPSLLQTESLEIYRGFSALAHGPNSIGGAIEYLTPSLGGSRKQLYLLGGSNSALRGRVLGTHKAGDWSGLLQATYQSSDGFKALDGGGPTGFKQIHGLLKLRYEFSNSHWFGLTASSGHERSSETYLGLSQEDFDLQPFRRYRASARDEMKWQHQGLRLEHLWMGDNGATLETKLYGNQFQRSWYRLNAFTNSSVRVSEVLKSPDLFPVYYDILRGLQNSSALGASTGNMIVVNNDRSYLSGGLQTRWQLAKDQHRWSVFGRVHTDSIRRDHTADRFEMTSGEMVRTGDPSSQTDLNKDSAQARTFVISDDIQWEQWILSLVARAESIQFQSTNDLSGVSKTRQQNYLVPGFGVTRLLTPEQSLRLSYHSATTVAGLATDGSEKPEVSSNLELEWKYQSLSKQLEAEITYFSSDYLNLTGSCSFSSGCTSSALDTQFNGGRAVIRGLEARLGHQRSFGTWIFPLYLNATLLQARFANDFTSDSEEWGVGDVRSGDPLPGVPETQYSLTVGSRRGDWQQDLTFSYTGARVTQAVQNGRETLAGFGIIDYSTRWKWREDLQLLAMVENLLDLKYAVSDRHFGLRPGKPRYFYVGVQSDF